MFILLQKASFCPQVLLTFIKVYLRLFTFTYVYLRTQHITSTPVRRLYDVTMLKQCCESTEILFTSVSFTCDGSPRILTLIMKLTDYIQIKFLKLNYEISLHKK